MCARVCVCVVMNESLTCGGCMAHLGFGLDPREQVGLVLVLLRRCHRTATANAVDAANANAVDAANASTATTAARSFIVALIGRRTLPRRRLRRRHCSPATRRRANALAAANGIVDVVIVVVVIVVVVIVGITDTATARHSAASEANAAPGPKHAHATAAPATLYR